MALIGGWSAGAAASSPVAPAPSPAGDLIAKAYALHKSGCGGDSGVACADVPLFINSLLGVGEYTAATVACDAVSRHGGLPGDALVPCADAAARLGMAAEATKWLERKVALAPEGAERIDAGVAAADLLIQNARFAAAGKFLRSALDASGGSPELQRRVFSNCLDAGDAACATGLAPKIAESDPTGEAALFVIREFFSHDLFQAALPVADVLQARGLSNLEQFGVVLQVFARAGARDRAGAAADACLKRCAGADVAGIAMTMSRSLMRREAAEFAEKHLDGFKDGDSARFELARLWISAGEVDRGFAHLRDWVRDARKADPDGKTPAPAELRERLLTASKYLLGERRWDKVLELQSEAVAATGSADEWTDEIAYVKVSALAGKKDWPGAESAAIAVIPGAFDPERLGYRLASILFEGKRTAAAATVVKACMKNNPAVDDLVRARLHLLTAKLIEAGAMQGDVQSEIRNAFEFAGADPQTVKNIAKFAAGQKLPPEFEILAAVNMAAANPGNPVELGKLADVYVKYGYEDEAVDAYRLLLKRTGATEKALIDAVDKLLAARFYGGAFQLAQSAGMPVEFPPAVARRLSDACLRIGERECVGRYLGIFLAGPVVDDYDYLRLGEDLIKGGYYEQAAKVLEVAGRAVPTDRKWRVRLLKGRLALFSGDLAGALKNYRGVMKMNPGNPAVAIAVSADYSKAGKIGEARKWVRKAIDSASDPDRLEIFPLWVDTMRRLGLSGEIDVKVVDGEMNSWVKAAGNAVDALIGAGRPDLAKTLLSKVDVDSAPAATIKRIEVAARMDDREAAVAAAASVCESPVRYADGACADACAAVADAGWPADGWNVLKRSAIAAGFQIPPREAASLVTEALKRGDAATALKAAERLEPSLYQNAARLEDVWPMFQAVVGHDAWRELLGKLATNADFKADGRVLMELGLTDILAGDVDRGLSMVRQYADAGAPMLAAAFRVLVVNGLVEQAAAVLDAAPDQVLENFGSSEVGMVMSSYISRGMTDRADKFKARYLKSLDNSVAARMNVALAGVNYDDTATVLAELRALDGPSMGPRDRLQYAAVLWTTGDRDAAIRQFRTVLAADAGVDEMRAYRKFVLGFLDSENAMAELADLLGNPPNPGYSDPEDDRALALAEVSIEGDEHLTKARQAIFRYLRGVRSITGVGAAGQGRDTASYVRLEARRGKAGGLASEAIARRGAAFAQVALFAACLDGGPGTDQIMRTAIERLAPQPAVGKDGFFTGVPTPVDILTTADLLFECGRWADASDMALRFLAADDVEVADMARAVSLAVRGALAAGRRNPVTPELINGISDDGLIRFSLLSAAARAAGDVSADSEAIRAGMGVMHEESTLFMDSIMAAIRSGNVTDISGFAQKSMESLTYPGRQYGLVLTTLFNTAQYAAAADFVKAGASGTGWTIDRLADLFRVQVESGDTAGALKTAEALLEPGAGRTRSIASLVAYAAAGLRRDIVSGLASRFLVLPTDLPEERLAPDVVDQMLGGAEFLFQTGRDNPTAVRIVDRIWNMALDRPGVCGQLVSRVMAAGPRETGFADYVGVMFGDGRCTAEALKNRLDDIRMVTSGGPGGSPALKGVYNDDGFITLMIKAVRTGMLTGRYKDAVGWCRFAFTRLGSLGDRITLSQALVDYMGDQTEVPSTARTLVARFALNAVMPDYVDNGRLSMLIAQILGMVQGGAVEERVVSAMNDEIRVAPASPHARNNLAYTLSTNELLQKRAIPEIRMASILAGMDRGAYLETEAWAWFKYGKKAKAAETQAEASRFWNRADLSVGLAECWNHYGNILEALGRRDEAIEMFRRSAAVGDAWNWHSILSMRKLDAMGFFDSREVR